MSEPIKMFPPIKRQLIESLHYLFENQSASSKVINYSFKKNKKWGSRDRRSFAEGFYTIVRHAGLYFSEVGLADFKNLTLEQTEKVVDLYLQAFKKEPEKSNLKHSVSLDLESVLISEMTEKERVEFLEESSKEAPVFLRVNTHLTRDDDCLENLRSEGFQVRLIKDNCIELIERKNIFLSPFFKKGHFEVQDGASQDVAHFLQLEKGMRVADTCAGAGGKSLHISALMENGGTVVSMDVFPRRLEELKKRSKRSQSQNIEIRPLSGSKILKRMAGKFDRVLMDVPCTGSGTFRRKPEAKLFFSKEEHVRLLQIQKEVLQTHSKLVKPGGKAVYATCSVLPSENKKQVVEFLENHKDFKLEEESFNKVGEGGFDGFYMARLMRSES